jgi:hypothetical protein
MPSIMNEQDEEFFYELSLQLTYEFRELEDCAKECGSDEDFLGDYMDSVEADEHFFMVRPGEQLDLFPGYDLPF